MQFKVKSSLKPTVLHVWSLMEATCFTLHTIYIYFIFVSVGAAIILQHSHFALVVLLGRATLHGKASLQIDQVRSEDQGWYECRVLMLEQQYDTFHNGSWVHLTVNGEYINSSLSCHLFTRKPIVSETLTSFGSICERPGGFWVLVVLDTEDY